MFGFLVDVFNILLYQPLFNATVFLYNFIPGITDADADEGDEGKYCISMRQAFCFHIAQDADDVGIES